ncbi:MAG: glutathione S-transferase N-terminal domain-containing protein [Pseudomonadota bacterium]
MTDNYIFYAAPLSYYSAKVRPYLKWKQIPHVEELSSAKIYQSVILPRVGWPVIPIVVTPEDQTWQDTTEIIDHFEDRFPTPSVYPEGPRQKFVALLMELYGDEGLKVAAMHYRWNYNEEWVTLEFGKTSAPDETEEQQRAIGAERLKPFKGFVPLLGVNEATIPAIEASYEGFLRDLGAHFKHHPYLLGTRPSIGDYGLVGPLYAHLYRDPASGEVMERVSPEMVAWTKRTHFPETPGEGSFLPNDEVPETLYPVLARQFREQMPMLYETVAGYAAWCEASDDREVPRALGKQKLVFDGLEDNPAAVCMMQSFPLWMLQRVYDHYHSLSGVDRAAVDTLLDAIGGQSFRDLKIIKRVKRENFKLVRADA